MRFANALYQGGYLTIKNVFSDEVALGPPNFTVYTYLIKNFKNIEPFSKLNLKLLAFYNDKTKEVSKEVWK